MKDQRHRYAEIAFWTLLFIVGFVLLVGLTWLGVQIQAYLLCYFAELCS